MDSRIKIMLILMLMLMLMLVSILVLMDSRIKILWHRAIGCIELRFNPCFNG